MNPTAFDGQQQDERILYTIVRHPFGKYLAITRVVLLAIFFYAVLLVISSVVPAASGILRAVGALLSLAFLLGGLWWNQMVYARDRTYITDRRIIRFDVVSPFFVTKRVLFWNEALKAKAYAPNLIYRFLKIGTLQVEPQMAAHENVRVVDVYYFEDLANYIDKILFTFKNQPQDIASLRPFVPKPRGQRDSAH